MIITYNLLNQLIRKETPFQQGIWPRSSQSKQIGNELTKVTDIKESF